ncbi:thiamine pyrophosphate-binding protein [Mycobacterium sp. AZCC_0083]|uniref:thiamine pyrophosphate-binding protein n=1 Tax=Mycobacterium sp. AZCC_0083 TaxID=2735882 RepID=UPI0016125192|nr:thiamine pyrophosphate-binding protein [Mycobacterium sp. AZCC_0083]MBB5167833.1 thiamine pyrophosphate-dependent acetolactate synthase large subunit-like protein [Mycobacterium sp. AZCC_0083]
MHVHEALAQALSDNDVHELFGVVGDANLFIIDSFRTKAGGRYVPTSSEAGAVMAAFGYAQVSGKLGAATVTHGPGLTNTLTALIEAQRGRVPMLVLAGDTPMTKHDHIQDIDQRAVVVSAGVHFHQVRSAASAVADIAEAVRLAWAEAAPVMVNIPIDIEWEEVDYQPILGAPTMSPTVLADQDTIEEAVGVIASADRPLVLAGRGARSDDARAAVVQLAARLGAPVATTLRGKDLFSDVPGNIGIFGTLSDDVALDIIGQADCVIAFGAGLNEWTTAEGALLDDKRVVHVDIDRARLNRYSHVNVAVAADAASAAGDFVRLLDEAEVAKTAFIDRAVQRIAARNTETTDRGTDDTVDIHTALRLVDSFVPSGRILVTDNGRFIKHAFVALHVEHPSQYVHAVNYGSIGLGIGVALGASYAAPDSPVLLAVGDGGFAEGGLSELVTAVMQRRNIIVLLLNDGAYGAEYVHLANRGMDPACTTLDWPDFGPIAAAIGAHGVTVRNKKELEDALEKVDFAAGPIVLDVRIDPQRV